MRTVYDIQFDFLESAKKRKQREGIKTGKLEKKKGHNAP